MVSMAAAKIAVLLAVVALFAAAGAADPQLAKGANCWRCYSSCMHKCDGYRGAAVRSANRTQPAVHTTVDDGAGAASIPVNSTDSTAEIAPSTDGAVAQIGDGYEDKDEDDDRDDDNDDKNDKDDDDDDDDDGKDDDDDGKDDDDDDDYDDHDDDDDDDDDDDNDDNDSGRGDWEKYFRCKRSCIVDCYKRLPPVCYKMCISESCLNMPPHKQARCYKSCGHKCYHKHPSPGPKPKPRPKPPKPKPTPPKPTPPKPAPPKPMPPPSPMPPKPMPPPSPMPPKPMPPPSPMPPRSTPPKPLPKRPSPPNAPKPKPKQKRKPPLKTNPKPKPPCPPSATVSASTNTSCN